jgi:homoprotocatechuate degradation regulator HpaR
MRRFDRSLPMALLRAREQVMGFFRPLLNEHGLTEQQWRIVRVLHEHDDMEFQQLARLACLQPPSLTGILTRLERLRLARRGKVAGDQRRLHVSLTGAGKARYELISREMERRYRDIESQFGQRRLATLFRLLEATLELSPPVPQSNAPARTRAKRKVKP